MFSRSFSVVAALFAVQSLAAPYSLEERTPCTAANIKVRKEWGSLPKAERKAYTDAVLCLQNTPSKLNSTEVPGAKNHYDDFLAVHINQTQIIHLSGYFLPWHRVFIQLYEEALQSCGYTGVQPYWNWPLWASNLTGSPIFDGSAYSMSGDGAYIANNSDIILGENVVLPHGNGGGCVTSGPFVNMIVPFRAFQFAEALTGTEPADRFDYTPRCLSRDLNTYIAERYTNQSDVNTLLATDTIADFQSVMSGTPGTYDLGSHGGGHYTMGPVGADMFASPGDPAFYLHHGMIDRMWTLWQAADCKERQYAISGTRTFLNVPPSANVTLSDTMNWGVLGPAMTVYEAMSVTSGPFCYIYE